MTDRTAHYQCILSHPDDDTPRLTYADRLEEEGELERAEFIRVQVELARAPKAGVQVRTGTGMEFVVPGYAALRSRERALFDAHGAEWFGRGAILDALIDADPPSPLVLIARGFPAHWYGPWEKWVGRSMNYEERSNYSCDVCGNVPDEDGVIEHGRGCYTQSDDSGGSSWVDLPNNGRIPGACETLAWRKGWDMECGRCKGHGETGYWTGDNQQTPVDWVAENCPTCHGSSRVPRPCPAGAVPLSDVTLTTMPETFTTRRGSAAGGNQLYMTIDSAEHPIPTLGSDAARVKWWCEQRWKGLRFHLPSERRETVPELLPRDSED